MNITLQSGDSLSGDLLISAIARTDLTPIPATLELTARGTSAVSPQLEEGAILYAGVERYPYKIVKVEKSNKFAGAQRNGVYPPISVTALYEPCHKIAFRRKTAVIKENVSLGDVYGACGASAKIGSDFSIRRFTCLVGGVPSFHIAAALQEEGGVLMLESGKLKFIRLRDLFSEQPKIAVAEELAENIESGFLERNEVPSFYSLDEAGNVVLGNQRKERITLFQPRSDTRILSNMTRALIKKKTLRMDYAPQICAGNLIQVGDSKYAVVTAAHVYGSGTEGDAIESYSKFWLAEIEE